MNKTDSGTPTNDGAAPVFHADIAEIRRLAGVMPGARPVAVNGVRVAASIRPRRFVIAGGDDTPVTMPRTAFQVVYPDGTVMIDSGLDKFTHDSFSDPDKPEPYFAAEFDRLRRALDAARMIVLTHFHADHVAGVLCAANCPALAAKTVVTAQTAGLMVDQPHRPHLKITPDQAAGFIVIDYPRYCPVAPGMVLIRSPGHSPDSQMVYIALQSGREILHSVDSAWISDNYLQLKGKAAPWVKEDVPAVLAQLRWLHDLQRSEPGITILVTHDDTLFSHLSATGVIGPLQT
jgi:glyoxylase-like metal-dependent hydrolase (beta-lactamase superfamily II)